MRNTLHVGLVSKTPGAAVYSRNEIRVEDSITVWRDASGRLSPPHPRRDTLRSMKWFKMVA